MFTAKAKSAGLFGSHRFGGLVLKVATASLIGKAFNATDLSSADTCDEVLERANLMANPLAGNDGDKAVNVNGLGSTKADLSPKVFTFSLFFV